jgi:anthranilate synthase component 1
MKGETLLNLSYEEYLTAVENQAKPLIIPLCAEIPLPPVSPLAVFEHLKTGSGFILESVDGSEKIARYSYVGTAPELVITIGGTVEIKGNYPFDSIAASPGGSDAVDRIRSILQRFNFVNVRAPRFFGGMVGYFGYDIIFDLYKNVRAKREGGQEFPVARFMLVKDGIVFDHVKKRLFVFASPILTYDTDLRRAYDESRRKIETVLGEIETLNDRVRDERPPHPGTRGHGRYENIPVSNISKEEFVRAVLRVKEYIAAGDIFQAVISRRIERPLRTDPFDLYRSLREINPSPYLYYLDFGDMQVIGSSPEMLVRVENRQVTTVPIAGTRPRGRTPEEDECLARELLADEKERAEHTMLVDLARNDIGKVSRFDSVRVDDFMAIEKFSHVQHIVSTVHGVLRDNLDCYDAFRSCFPAGTVSGAPKVRAMQIIDEIEPCSRGPYAGAVGYLGFNRNLECAITIRTIIAGGGRASVQVGAGIVADSVPENEWNETENKARGMLAAIDRAEEES